jgi:hypothetical protein
MSTIHHSRLLVFCLAIAGLSARNIAGQTATAQVCGADQGQPPQRSFADPDAKNIWREYRSIDAVPQLSNDGGEIALLWAGGNGDVLVGTKEPGEDFAIFTDYCFDSNGRLIQLRFEVRTAWGWGYRKEGPVLHGTLRPKIAEFFDTITETPVAKPQQAADIPQALKPKLYLRKSQLPFSKLLSK